MDPNTLKQARDFSRKEILFSCAKGMSETQLLASTSDGKVLVFDLAAEPEKKDQKIEPKVWEGHSSYVTGVAVAGKVALSGGYDCRLIWWNLETGEKIRAVDDAHAKWIRGVAASPDGKYFVTIADDMIVRVWEAETGKKLHELAGHAPLTPNHYPSMLYAVTISADSKLIATGDKVGHIIVWNAETGAKEAELDAPVMYTWDPKQRRHSIGGLRSLAFSPDGKLLAAGGMGQVGNIDHLEGNARVEVFEWREKKQVHEFAKQSFKGLVEHVEFAPGGEWLVGAGGAGDGFLMFFDLATGKCTKEQKAPMHIHDLILAEGGKKLLSVGHQRVVLWEMESA